MTSLSSLAKGTQSVQGALEGRVFGDTRVMELSASTRTAVEVGAALACQVGQIVKSLIFKTAQSHQPVLVLARDPTRGKEKVIEGHVGEPIVKADGDFMGVVTGFAIGSVPSLGHAPHCPGVY